MLVRIVYVAGVTPGERGEAHGKRVAQRKVHRSACPISRAVPVVHTIHGRLEPAAHAISGGINRDELEQTTEATRAIKRPLRSAQLFDTHQIARIEIGQNSTASQ